LFCIALSQIAVLNFTESSVHCRTIVAALRLIVTDHGAQSLFTSAIKLVILKSSHVDSEAGASNNCAASSRETDSFTSGLAISGFGSGAFFIS